MSESKAYPHLVGKAIFCYCNGTTIAWERVPFSVQQLILMQSHEKRTFGFRTNQNNHYHIEIRDDS